MKVDINSPVFRRQKLSTSPVASAFQSHQTGYHPHCFRSGQVLCWNRGQGRGKAPKKGFLKPPHARVHCKSKYAGLQRKSRPANQTQSEPAACFGFWLGKQEICKSDLKMREERMFVCVPLVVSWRRSDRGRL
ncbi:uncharacterized [Tachysurus ichikawai]